MKMQPTRLPLHRQTIRIDSSTFLLVNLSSHTMVRTAFLICTLIGALQTAGPASAQVNVEQIVRQKARRTLPKNDEGGGVGVAVQTRGKTAFFSYGVASD